MTKGCYDIRLWGDGITAKCFGTNALVIRQSVKGLPQKLCSAKVQTPATLHVCMYVHMNVHVHVYGTLCICCMNVCMSCM